MTCQLNFWLFRSGPSLRLCAVIPARNFRGVGTVPAAATTYASPGSFLARLDATIFDSAKTQEIKSAVFHAIGTLDHVFTIPEIDLSAEQIGTLGLGSTNLN